MRPFLRKASYLSLTLVLAAGCQDLDVANTNAPDRERALNEPGDVLTLMTSAYGGVHGRTFTSSSSYLGFPNIADEGTATYANAASLEMSSEPRVPYNNNPTSDASGLARFQWEDWYGVIADVNDVLGAMDGGLELTVTDASGETNYDQEARLWGKLLQGWAHSYLGALFDQAFIYTEADLDKGIGDLTLQPYPEILAAGHDLLHDAIDYAAANPGVTVPAGWMGPMPEMPAAEVAKIAHIIAARSMIFGARNPDERAAVDWSHVMQHLNQTFTSDFIMEMDNSFRHTGVYYWINGGSFKIHCDYKNCGPADTSGKYQNWLATPFADRMPFDIVTPDQRFPQVPLARDKESPAGYFQYDDRSSRFRPERGTYHASHYKHIRIPDYRYIDYAYFGVDEVDLLKAEAHYHMGQMDQAVTLINKYRVGNGGLPPVTTAGVPGTPGNCVPMMSTVTPTCGDLLQALMYERRMELLNQDALYGYLDSRGFGRLSDGTFIHLPIPGRELATLGMELYSFGGVGGPGAAVNVR